MGNNIIKKNGYAIISIAVFITILLEIKAAIGAIPKGFSLLFLIIYILISCWILMPYILMGYALKFFSEVSTRLQIWNCIAIAMASAIGLYRYLDVIYIHPDAQGGIAFFYIPATQVVIYTVSSMFFGFIEWIYRKIK